MAFKYGQWGESNARLGFAIFTGTFPILLAGMAIKFYWNNFEDSPFRSIPSIALISIFMALLIALAEKTGKRKKKIERVSGKDGFIIGLGQILALIPGVSRSGVTLTTALFNGWKRQDAARFSFLLGIPAISFAGLAELKNTFHGEFTSGVIPLIIGISSAAVVSWLAIDWLLKYLQNHSTWIFVTYRLFFGMALLMWWRNIPSN